MKTQSHKYQVLDLNNKIVHRGYWRTRVSVGYMEFHIGKVLTVFYIK
jgi:hypothetical protein